MEKTSAKVELHISVEEKKKATEAPEESQEKGKHTCSNERSSLFCFVFTNLGEGRSKIGIKLKCCYEFDRV